MNVAIDKIKKMIFESISPIDGFDNFKQIIISEPPAELKETFDIATNTPMVLAKKLNTTPEKLALQIVKNLTFKVENAQFAKPGFINIKMKTEFWQEEVQCINQDYGFNKTLGNNEKINVEFVSCNPTGPMHIGHVRGAIYGDVLCNLLEKSGFDVTREFYINDAGGQIDILAKSFLFRYEQVIGKRNKDEIIPQGFYPGEYITDNIEEAIEINKKNPLTFDKFFSNPTAENAKEAAVDMMMRKICGSDLLKLKVLHNEFISEKNNIQNKNKINEAFDILQKKGLIYKGKLDVPKGKLPEDWEEREQDLFKSTVFGDDVDRPLKKSDGSYTYFAGDVGYHYDKIQRGFNKMVLVLGSDHKGYKKRISAVVNALSDGKAEIEVKLCELVNFLKNGEPVKMSKRAGNFLLASDVLEEVDVDIIRFMMLIRKNDTILNFDFEKVKEQSKDNPVFYVQYAYARCCSVEKKIEEKLGKIEAITPDLTDNNLRQLVINLCYYPQIVNTAVTKYEPHLLIFYIIDIASQFHSIWNTGIRFVDESNIEKTKQNLAIILSVKNIIASVLSVCNIIPMEKM